MARMIDRVQQARIFGLLKDMALHFGEVYPEYREIRKKEFVEILRKQKMSEYWGEQAGEFSLSLNKCTYKDGELFYYYLQNIALREGVHQSKQPT